MRVDDVPKNLHYDFFYITVA
ncbi:hypothetical protein BQ8794_50225 [Mesorhizobium prunaredense]|uniref:Uncharacterized protein n=1 Tax=Mesorhizobium prunaredense TaxID=1631249 RepID=A0A1R3VE75_9HYPH|nr:hypothetical protein BQ8794_50225 [Mesorhizobium prunaredense]